MKTLKVRKDSILLYKDITSTFQTLLIEKTQGYVYGECTATKTQKLTLHVGPKEHEKNKGPHKRTEHARQVYMVLTKTHPQQCSATL